MASTLATVEGQTHNTVYVMPDGGSSAQAREFPTDGFPNFEVGWTPDGQLLTSVIRGSCAAQSRQWVENSVAFSDAFPGIRPCLPRRAYRILGASRKQNRRSYLPRGRGWRKRERTLEWKIRLHAVVFSDSKTVIYADADSKLEKVGIDGGASQTFPTMPTLAGRQFPRMES